MNFRKMSKYNFTLKEDICIDGIEEFKNVRFINDWVVIVNGPIFIKKDYINNNKILYLYKYV